MIYPPQLNADLKLKAPLSTWNNLIYLVNQSSWRTPGLRRMHAHELLIREQASKALTDLGKRMLKAQHDGKREVSLKLSLTQAVSLFFVVRNLRVLPDVHSELHQVISMLHQHLTNYNHLVDLSEL